MVAEVENQRHDWEGGGNDGGAEQIVSPELFIRAIDRWNPALLNGIPHAGSKAKPSHFASSRLDRARRTHALSDLHGRFGHIRLVEVKPGVVVLGGAIARTTPDVALARMALPAVPVLWVTGNYSRLHPPRKDQKNQLNGPAERGQADSSL